MQRLCVLDEVQLLAVIQCNRHLAVQNRYSHLMTNSSTKWKNHADSSYFRASWKTVAFGALGVSCALFASLVVVSFVTRADSLATIALMLAILSFVVQIMLFIADTFSSARRDQQAYSVYADTQALLAKIDEKTNATNDVINQQLNKMIDRFMLNVKAVDLDGQDDATDGGVDAEEQARILIEEFRRTVSEVQREATASSAPRKENFSRERSALIRIREWPSENLAKKLAQDGLSDLSLAGQDALRSAANDYARSLGTERIHGLPIRGNSEGFEELLKIGALTMGGAHPDVVRLTGMGKAAARLVLADGRIPDYINAFLPWVSNLRATSQS